MANASTSSHFLLRHKVGGDAEDGSPRLVHQCIICIRRSTFAPSLFLAGNLNQLSDSVPHRFAEQCVRSAFYACVTRSDSDPRRRRANNKTLCLPSLLPSSVGGASYKINPDGRDESGRQIGRQRFFPLQRGLKESDPPLQRLRRGARRGMLSD